MKLICPYCELAGTAEDRCYSWIVRCPECQAMFRVTDEVVIDFTPGQSSEAASSTAIKEHAADAGEPEKQVENPKDNAGLLECTLCGFTFSNDFITIVDGKNICPVCIN